MLLRSIIRRPQIGDKIVSTRFSILGSTDKVVSDWKKIIEKELFQEILSPLRWSNASQEINKQRLQKIDANYKQGAKRTIVAIPSLSFDQSTLKGIKGIKHYETRSLWSILKANCKNTNVVFISSVPIDLYEIDNLRALHPNGNDIKKRTSFLTPNDPDSTKTLTEKILADKNLLKTLRSIIDPDSTFMEVFITTSEERKLAEELDIPFLGHGEAQDHLMRKSANRRIFKKANINHPAGIENITSKRQLFNAFCKLNLEHPKTKRFMFKLDIGVSGEGNAFLDLPKGFCSNKFKAMSTYQKLLCFYRILKNLKPQSAIIPADEFVSRISDGSILEVFLEGDIKYSPSVQGEIGPDGKLRIISSHEQVLDTNGMTFLGCEYPAKQEYRKQIELETFKVGQILQYRGVLGRFGVDYLVAEDGIPYAIEINLRQGGTTHPYELASRLTNSDSKTDVSLHYISSDNLKNPLFSKCGAKPLVELAKKNDLIFSTKKENGIVFHLLHAANDSEKIGYIAIGRDAQEAKNLSQEIEGLCRSLKS